MKSQRVNVTANISAGFVLALFGVATLSEAKLLWGFDIGAYLPVWVAWVALATGILLMWPRVASTVQGQLAATSAIIAEDRRLRVGVPALLALAFLILFQAFGSSSSLLGDAVLRLNQIEDGRLFLFTETGDFLVHAILGRLYFIPNQIGVEQCYHAVSVACGFFFVLGAWRLATYLKPQQSLLLFLVLICPGMTVLFFGYIESYSILAAMIPFVLLTAVKVVDGTQSPWKFVLLYLAAGLVHSVAFFLFFGVLLVVLFLARCSTAEGAKIVGRNLSLMFAAILCLGYLGRSIGWLGLERQLLGLVGQEGYQLALLTTNHGWDLINWLLLSGLPIVLFLPTLIAHRNSDEDRHYPRAMLAVWLAVPSVMFVLFFTPQLGGSRDWDLFSLPMFLIVSGVLIGYLSRTGRRIPHQILPVLLVGAVTTFAFAIVNSSPLLSADRFVHILNTTKFKNQIQEYIALMDHAREYPELSDRRLDFALAAWAQPPYKQIDSSFVLNYLNWMSGYRSRDGHVPINVPAILKSEGTNRDRMLLLANYYLRFGDDIERKETAELLERRFETDVKTRLYAGLLYLKLNQLDSCKKNLHSAYLLDSNDVEVLTAYAAYRYQVGEPQSAIDMLNRAVDLNPNSFQAHHTLAVANYESGDMNLARQHLLRAKDLAASQAHRRMVEKTLREVAQAIQDGR